MPRRQLRFLAVGCRFREAEGFESCPSLAGFVGRVFAGEGMVEVMIVSFASITIPFGKPMRVFQVVLNIYAQAMSPEKLSRMLTSQNLAVEEVK
jgi:hypothetical protein